jgi:hypothetical protein
MPKITHKPIRKTPSTTPTDLPQDAFAIAGTPRQ